MFQHLSHAIGLRALFKNKMVREFIGGLFFWFVVVLIFCRLIEFGLVLVYGK